MSTKAFVARDTRRDELSKRHAQKRADLKKKIIDPNLSVDEQREAMFALAKMPRDGSRSRLQRRCQATGNPHAVYRKFKLNRITFRNMALQGLLPGVTKASW